MKKIEIPYQGFETGPIRPPSEGYSLLLRVTRNCPWNRCKFCGLYKGEKFSIRDKEEVKEDIRAIRTCIDVFESIEGLDDTAKETAKRTLLEELGPGGKQAYQSARSWYRAGMESVFLQDANTMIIKPDDLVEILAVLRDAFPGITRITSYGRAHTIARISDEDLRRIADAGLNRIHIGMESGSDTVLKLIDKGVDKETQIRAGLKVKQAGIELSEYYMPGLGGREYSVEHARETADAMNRIDPDFIRIRTLAVTERSDLYEEYENGVFTRTSDTDMVRELLLFIESLEGIDSMVKSDHILNLLPEVEGRLPEDKETMITAMKWYLDLSERDRMLFSVGRRAGILRRSQDFEDEWLKEKLIQICAENDIRLENADQAVDQLMNRFI